MRAKVLSVLGLIGLGVVGRLLPHLPNATPVTAISLTASKHLGRVWAVVVPLAAMLISDFFIGFYNWRVMVSVYFSFACIGVLGYYGRAHWRATAVTLVGASLLFFIITNGAVWLFSPWYPKTLWGLLYAYELGLPFLRNMLIGDLFYTSVLLSVTALYKHPRVAAHAAYLRAFFFPSPVKA